MVIITVKNNNTYTADVLYQWDTNRVLAFYGLNLTSVPEIHFANAKTDKAIVKQATSLKNGAFKVTIPNFLLETSTPIRVFVCTYEGEEIEVVYNTGEHPHDNHTIEYYEDQDSIYHPTPTYIILPDPKVDPVYGEYYDIDEIPGIKPYDVGNSVWDENGFSLGIFKCYECERFECKGCEDHGYRFIVRIYSAKYDTRLNDTEN